MRVVQEKTIHGVLVGIEGLGVLILGDSGIGKSEVALELISRGHCIVSDDSVTINRTDEFLIGRSPELTAGFLEIRGLGVIDVGEVFGSPSLEKERKIDLCIELTTDSKLKQTDRLESAFETKDLLGVRVPKLTIPVGSGVNTATIIETSAKLFRLHSGGNDAGSRLAEKHNKAVRDKK